MARVAGELVMHGNKNGDCELYIDLAGIALPPHYIRRGGYYGGHSSLSAMKNRLQVQAAEAALKASSISGEKPQPSSREDMPTLESQSSTESLKQETDCPEPVTVSHKQEIEAEINVTKEEVLDRQIKVEMDILEEVPGRPGVVEMNASQKVSERRQAVEMDALEAEVPEKPGLKEMDATENMPDILSVKEMDAQEEVPYSPHSAENDGLEEEDRDRLGAVHIDSGEDEVSDRPNVVGGLQKLKIVKMPVRAVGRMPPAGVRDVSSDENEEVKILQIDDYSILDEENKAVSLLELPLHYRGHLLGGSGVEKLYVMGKSGGKHLLRPICAWKLVCSPNQPLQFHVKIVLMEESYWVKLVKPEIGYKRTLERLLLVARFLDFAKKDPNAPEDAVSRCLFERDAAKKTICDYMWQQLPLIEQYVTLDPILTDSDVLKTLQSVLLNGHVTSTAKRTWSEGEENDSVDDNQPLKKQARVSMDTGEDGKRKEKVAEDVSMGEGDRVGVEEEEEEEEEKEEEEDDDEVDEDDEALGDPLCIICDDGGDLLCCDGPCMRSFHAYPEAGEEAKCKSLGFEKAAVETMDRWLCKNCEYKKHQCYICGKLGASDETLGLKREVFVCDVALCGKFYHPQCIAKESAPLGEQRALARNIQDGKESFTCPLHRCQKCGKGEDKEVEDLRLAKCRRCTAAWHKKCLPETIRFDTKYGQQRAWEVGIRRRFVIYCTKHIILRYWATPTRDQYQFPEPPRRQPETSTSTMIGEDIILGSVVRAADLGKVAGGSSVKHKHQQRAPYESLFVGRVPRPEIGPNDPLQELPKQKEQLQREKSASLAISKIIAESEQKVTHLMVKSRLKFPRHYKETTHRDFIHDGKLVSILNAAGKAMEKLRRGGAKEDAYIICSRADVESILMAEEYLKTFLAPTFHGNRYTSFGRHFTKVEKLTEVVERLHPYINDGDMLVDFSCGENTFSVLMHEALSQTGKMNCKYKNYDIFAAKITFNFELKDWFQVTKQDLPDGGRLVIGLNPPFAGKESFISHALIFRPRLLILIIPPEKKSLENRGYTCIWDDAELMADKSFYLPGSVHKTDSDGLDQGNKVPPHLYLYCRRDYADQYRKMAEGLYYAAKPKLQKLGNKVILPAENEHRKEWRPNPSPDSAHPPHQPQPFSELFVPLRRQKPSLADSRIKHSTGRELLSGDHNRLPNNSKKKKYKDAREFVHPATQRKLSSAEQSGGFALPGENAYNVLVETDLPVVPFKRITPRNDIKRLPHLDPWRACAGQRVSFAIPTSAAEATQPYIDLTGEQELPSSSTKAPHPHIDLTRNHEMSYHSPADYPATQSWPTPPPYTWRPPLPPPPPPQPLLPYQSRLPYPPPCHSNQQPEFPPGMGFAAPSDKERTDEGFNGGWLDD